MVKFTDHSHQTTLWLFWCLRIFLPKDIASLFCSKNKKWKINTLDGVLSRFRVGLFISGNNEHAQLGFPPPEYKLHYNWKELIMPVPFVQISSGMFHALAVDQNGGLWCWGANSERQLGLGDALPRNTPTRNPFQLRVRYTQAVNVRSLLITESNSLYSVNSFKYGSLVPDQEFTISPELENKVAQIACGVSHNLCLTRDGTLYGWGNNGYGVLGIGTHDVWKNTFQQITLPNNLTVLHVFAGANSSYCISGDGKLWSWGANESGQLGINSTQFSNVPVQVPIHDEIIQMSVGDSHVLCLCKNQVVYVWGSNRSGQLANGSKTRSVACQKLKLAFSVEAVQAIGDYSYFISSKKHLWESGGGRSTVATLVKELGEIIGAESESPTSQSLFFFAEKTVESS